MRAGSLEVEGISKRFGGLLAVKNMSFTVRAGEILGLRLRLDYSCGTVPSQNVAGTLLRFFHCEIGGRTH
jgi:ABC-type phosphonate transport system ATPase subunit